MRRKRAPSMPAQREQMVTAKPRAGQRCWCCLKGTPLSQNNVAKEAGVDPSARCRARFLELVTDIQAWIGARQYESPQKTPRQMMLTQRSRNRDFQEQNHALKGPRDNALGQQVDAQARILASTLESQRSRAWLSQSNVVYQHRPNLDLLAGW